MQIRPDSIQIQKSLVGPATSAAAPTPRRDEVADPVDLRVSARPAPTPATTPAPPPSPVEVPESIAPAPRVLPYSPEFLVQFESEVAPVRHPAPARPATGTEAAPHRHAFESRLPAETREAWSETWTYAKDYDSEAVDLPFPFPGREGRLDLGDVPATVQGLQALGAHGTARGVLENWLDLGERFSALPGTTRLNELGRSAPPRLSSLLLDAAQEHPDPQFLSRSYAVVAGDHRNTWSDRYFHLTPTGLARYTDVDYSHEATLIESGGIKNTARFEGDPGSWNAVDLNAWLYRTEKDLETMARSLAERSSGPEATELAEQADDWGRQAADRKARILDTLWDAESGMFLDWNYREKRFSNVPTLASYSVLTAGVLDPSVPRERDMIDSMAQNLQKFSPQPGGLPAWNMPGAGPEEAADATDLVTVIQGLQRVGRAQEAEGLRQATLEERQGRPPQADIRELGALAALRAGSQAAPPAPEGPVGDLSEWMSPEGRARLLDLGGEGSTVRPADAGALDRRLRQFHPSMLEPEVTRDLRERNLFPLFYGIGQTPDGGWLAGIQSPVGPGRPLAAEEPVRLGPIQFKAGVGGARLHAAADGAVVLRAGGVDLPIALSGEKVILGDRAYDLSALPRDASGSPILDLPRGILGDFSQAGGNPTLETFYDVNRSWLEALPASPPASSVGELPGRPGWKALNDLVEGNWPDLTFAPSVVAKETNVQYFHPAAVPSVGIFKTQFNWDSYFMARGMNLQGQGTTVVGMADNLLYLLKTTGRVPNAARSVYLNKSQPPILPMLVREAAPVREAQEGRESTDRWLSEAHDLMARDYDGFWCRVGPSERGIDQIEGHQVRLARYGGDNSKFAMDESGFDTTSRFEGRALDVVPVELNSFLWQYARQMEDTARTLAEHAREKGDIQAVGTWTTKAARWQAEAATRKADLIRWCWDEEDGMFRDRVFQGEGQGLMKSQDSLAPTVAPIWVGMLDPKDPKEARMLERSLDNLARFEKEHGPAAMASDYGHPEMQWNGPSGWAPLTMMTLEAQAEGGRYDAVVRNATRWLDTIQRNHDQDGVILERYNVETGGPPPIQKGRYEETQGEGPGFGWTNASIPFTLLEIVGGARVERPAVGEATLRVAPHLPKDMEGEPVRMEYRDPAGKGAWQVEHTYDSSQGSYSGRVSGDFSATPNVRFLTPPLPAGHYPLVQAPVEHRTRVLPSENGLVRYEVTLEDMVGSGEVRLEVGQGD